ncbi:MAG: hypothetical protein HGN29_09735 [Asgard group archaeon]|nr:hypothetical protein [Asgard group archaeon]
MNKTKLFQALKLNLISAVIMIVVFAIILLVFYAIKGAIGEWPLEIWGIVTIFIVMIYSFVYQSLGRYGAKTDGTET